MDGVPFIRPYAPRINEDAVLAIQREMSVNAMSYCKAEGAGQNERCVEIFERYARI